jgi:hypothetical protein
MQPPSPHTPTADQSSVRKLLKFRNKLYFDHFDLKKYLITYKLNRYTYVPQIMLLIEQVETTISWKLLFYNYTHVQTNTSPFSN